jgi:hypothetical protein
MHFTLIWKIKGQHIPIAGILGDRYPAPSSPHEHFSAPD